MSLPSIDVVVPARNEAETLPELLRQIRALPGSPRVVVVDDGSMDSVAELLRDQTDVLLIRHETGRGYGAAIDAGVRAGSAERIVVIDADLEYSPADIPGLAQGLDEADLVLGTRFAAPTGRGAPGAGIARTAGNRILTSFYNRLFGQRITDLYCGMRAFRRSAYEAARPASTGFDHVVELAARVAQGGGRVTERPVSYAPRSTGESKMRHAPEAIRFVAQALRIKLGAPGAGQSSG